MDKVLAVKGVTEEQLNTPFSKEDASRIALKITDWKALAPFIDLEEVEEEEIAEEKGAQAKRQKMMRVWIQKFGERATYLRFVEGCERIQRRDLEEAVCDLVRERIHEASDSQGVFKAQLPKLKMKPSMRELLLFTGKSGQQYRIMDRLAPHWEKFAYGLGFEGHTIAAVQQSNSYQVDRCCQSIIQRWIEGQASQPVTWETFLEAMEYDAGLAVLKKTLQSEF